MNKLINSDNNIADRAIFKELKAKNSLLIKREANLRRLWQSPNIFTTFECIQMETVPLGECCDYVSPCKISKSVKKIPQIAEGIFGLLIQSVYNVDGSVQYKYSTPVRYSNILKLKLKDKASYFWIVNEHLYVTNPEVERVNMRAFPDDYDIDAEEFNSCKSIKSKDTNCVNPLDKPFNSPSYLEDNLVTLVNKTLSETYFRHTVDTQSDNKDEQR